jgi:hypothetical protein
MIKKSYELSDSPFALAMPGNAYGRLGRKEDAHKIIDELDEISKEKYVAPGNFALVYTGLGENDLAFQWLEEAFKVRDPLMLNLKAFPEWDNIRDDLRFDDLLKRMDL